MAPSVSLVVALLRLASADLEEMSMLQMPVAAHEFGVETDTSECRCAGYFEDKCIENADKGCIWSQDYPDTANAPWCQCDPDYVYDPVVDGPQYQDYLPTTLPDEALETTTAAARAPTAAPVETTAAAEVETPAAEVETTAAPLGTTTAAPRDTTTPAIPLSTLPASGFYRMQQVRSMRFLDAYEDEERDYQAVTREAQDNPSQWWFLQSSGDVQNQVYTIQHVGNNDGTANGRFVDARQTDENDFNIMTREEQRNDSQRWHFINIGLNTFTITQVGFNDGRDSGRFFDAYSTRLGEENDYRCMTREDQSETGQADSQQWVMTMLVGEEAETARGLLQSLS